MSWSTYLFKEHEDDETVTYLFSDSPTPNRFGKIRYNKKTQMVTELEEFPNSPEFYFKQAAYCVFNQAKSGYFPDKISRHI